jgi:putative methyltransferase
MLVYFADLAHDHFKVNQYTPTGIGYLTAYSKFMLRNHVEFRLFKSVNKLLDTYEKEKPDLVGLSNYTWNTGLSKFVGNFIKKRNPSLPIIMGGPNIRIDKKGIEKFLRKTEYVDTYCMFAGEFSVYEILKFLLSQPRNQRTSNNLRKHITNGCYSIYNDRLIGNSNYTKPDDLDEIPSPFLTGLMDPFLQEGHYPIIETNRGCPFSCTFCVWGISALNKVLKFSMNRVKNELSYVAKSTFKSTAIVLGDANFGILPRDVEIAQHVRNLYDETKSFSSLKMYWAKISKPHMLDIGKILGHLTHTYIAFQSLDDKVLENIKRKNIRSMELLDLIKKLKGFTYGVQTDLLVGLPGETYLSHLNSLEKVLSLGITQIFGGEIQMLPGADMDTELSRKRFGLKTKYRFFEGGYGIYRDEFVYELQESIRETNTMTEKEMLKLRALRAFFYASVTLGEHLPLVHYLTKKGVRFTKVCEELVIEGIKDSIFKKTVNWLLEQSISEWYDSPEKVADHINKTDKCKSLFKEKIFVRLNTGLFAKICLDQKQYEAYYFVFEMVLEKFFSKDDMVVISEILKLCRERNYFMRYIKGDKKRSLILKLLPVTMDALVEGGFITSNQRDRNSNFIEMKIDSVIAKYCAEFIDTHPKMTLLDLTQVLMLQSGKFLMKPVINKSNSNFHNEN